MRDAVTTRITLRSRIVLFFNIENPIYDTRVIYVSRYKSVILENEKKKHTKSPSETIL